jgi:hypothetical protein
MHVFLAALHANHVHESDQDIRAPCMNLIPHSIYIPLCLIMAAASHTFQTPFTKQGSDAWHEDLRVSE